MMKTNYFTSTANYLQAEQAVKHVIAQRDEFIKLNMGKIKDIASEDIKAERIDGNMVLGILRLSYYPV